MAYQRKSRTFGGRRITTTTNTKTGKITYSETTAGKTKPGQTRITTSWGGGKTNTTRTTNLGGGWFSKETSNGNEARRRKQQREAQKFWATVFGKKKKAKQEKATLSSWVALGIMIVLVVLYLK